MAVDANVVIGLLTLLVTCALGVLFLMRFISRYLRRFNVLLATYTTQLKD